MGKRELTVTESIDEHVRQNVARAIENGTVVDVPYESGVIAQAHGLRVTAKDISAKLAEAAVAARVPVYLSRSAGPDFGPN